MTVTVREAIRLIEGAGWYLARTRGSHWQYKHPSRPGRVTIAGQLGEELRPGTWASIQRQAGRKGGPE